MAGPKRIAINGCGRIGRLALRLAWSQADAFTIVKLNDVAAVESVAYLIKYDSVHGTWGPSVSVEGSTLVIREGDRSVAVAYTKQSKPAELAWGDIDLVLECTGQFLTRATLQPYFTMGVKKVVVSAPVKDPNPVLNIVYGVNHDQYTGAEDIVTAASCTTNCLAPGYPPH